MPDQISASRRFDREHLLVIRQDLEHICTMRTRVVDEGSLRRLSVQLRRMFVDSLELVAVWKDIVDKNTRPSVLAAKLFGKERTDAGGLFRSSGPPTNSAASATCSYFFVPRPLGASEIRAMYEESKRGLQNSFTIDQYIESTALSIDATRISRREVIQYVANKSGGAHFDSRRKLTAREKDVLAALDRCKERVLWTGFEESGREVRLELNVVYCELLAVCHHLEDSPDIVALRQHLKSL